MRSTPRSWTPSPTGDEARAAGAMTTHIEGTRADVAARAHR